MSSFPANVLPVSCQDFSVGFHSVVFGFFLIHFLSWCLLFSCHLFSPPSVAVPPSTRHAKGSRRRQKGSDYTSTSDEEYDSNQSTPKYKRSQPPSASHSPRSQPRPRPQPVVALHPKGHATDSEDDRRENEAHGWSNHSAEIAR